jgi:hypothetical protein
MRWPPCAHILREVTEGDPSSTVDFVMPRMGRQIEMRVEMPALAGPLGCIAHETLKPSPGTGVSARPAELRTEPNSWI